MLGHGVDSPDDAEALGHALMIALGFHDAHRTAPGADGGVDVLSSSAVCQVKDWSTKVGRPQVQALHGAALGRSAVFLASSYSGAAIEWANQALVALFLFDRAGRVTAANPAAIEFLGNAESLDSTARQRTLAKRITRANSWLQALSAEASRLGTTPAGPRQRRRNARRVAAYQRRLPKLQRDFQKVADAAFLKIAPYARLSSRLDSLEKELRGAARDLGIKLHR